MLIHIPYLNIEFAPLDIPRLSQATTEIKPITLQKGIDVSEDKTILPLACEYSIGGSRQSISIDLMVDVVTLYSSDLEEFEGLFDV